MTLAVLMALTAMCVVEDSRPKEATLVDCGTYGSDDIDFNFSFTTPSEMYRVFLREHVAKEGLRLRYTMSSLPETHVFHLGFGTTKRDLRLNSFPLAQLGVLKLHIHLQTSKGEILISQLCDTRETFPSTLPIFIWNSSGLRGFISHGSSIKWEQRPNTGNLAAFRPAKGETYILELTIVETSPDAAPMLRPLIRS
ncbi:MAG: hypothetical protein KDB03_24730 [Planctomycetales bacterium]|nr:hypothetical protein [Planctomycetales bacterium]